MSAVLGNLGGGCLSDDECKQLLSSKLGGQMGGQMGGIDKARSNSMNGLQTAANSLAERWMAEYISK